MRQLSKLELVALLLTIIGSINWGLIGLIKFNIIGFLLGDLSVFARLIYAVIGLASVWVLIIFVNSLPKKPYA